MNDSTTPRPSAAPLLPASSWKKKLLIVFAVILGCCGLTAAATAWWVKRNIYASPLHPVSLTQQEKQAFDEKVSAISGSPTPGADGKSNEQRAAEEKRTLTLSEKEINAFLNERGIGDRVKVELSEGGVQATALVPVDKEVPVFGGKTIRLAIALAGNMGSDRQAAFRIADVSVGGVPVPNAWLGDLKGVNLLASNIESDPVVTRFLAGIREFEFKRGAIRVLLNE